MFRTRRLWIPLYFRIVASTTHRLQSRCVSSRTVCSSLSSSLLESKVSASGFVASGKHFARFLCSQVEGRASAQCWHCQTVAQTFPFLVCDSCRTIQSVDHSINYYQIFGLEKKYDIEDEGLESKYKNWQKKLHPDLVHSKSEREREYAAEQSARVIDAYHTLSNPLSRAIYILKLEGGDVDEEETISEPELLNEIMETRESVEEAADVQELKMIQSQIQEKLRHWSNSFANAFRRHKFEEAVSCIRRMTYYERVNEEIVKKL